MTNVQFGLRGQNLKDKFSFLLLLLFYFEVNISIDFPILKNNKTAQVASEDNDEISSPAAENQAADPNMAPQIGADVNVATQQFV